ncbi:hypothetical protein Hanom_Chr17g01566481 [Helianthus anomalus]
MRHMETWIGFVEGRWDAGFPTEISKAKNKIRQLRKKFVVKLIILHANIPH